MDDEASSDAVCRLEIYLVRDDLLGRVRVVVVGVHTSAIWNHDCLRIEHARQLLFTAARGAAAAAAGGLHAAWYTRRLGTSHF